MSNRTNSFPPFTPDISETPASTGFKPATLISSSEVNGAIYMNYNFVNSFVNALIEKSSLTDGKEYSYNSTELKTLIEGDIDSWIADVVSNGTLSKLTLTNVTNTAHLTATYTSLEIENTNKEFSSLNATSLVFTANSGDDVGTYSDNAITFKTSGGYTSTYGTSTISLYDDDGKFNATTSSVTINDNSGKIEIKPDELKMTRGSYSYDTYIDANHMPVFVAKLSNGNTISINSIPYVATYNIYSGFTALYGVYTKEFTATSSTEAVTLDTAVKNFINDSGLTIHGITITRPFSSSDDTFNFIQLFVTRSGTSSFNFSYYDVSSASMKTSTSLNYFYTTGTMSVKVICN